MAEKEEEIIIIEEEDAAEISDEELHVRYIEEYHPKLRDNKIVWIALGVFFLLMLILLIVLMEDDPRPPKTSQITIEKEQTEEEVIKSLTPSQVEKMITRADFLYEQGQKDDALGLYQKIAMYSEAVSYYNLGVAQMKNKQYEEAINKFDLAIKNNENLCVSALNAAVCALELNAYDQFNKYINQAQAYLPKELESPLYSYYYALINYYKGNYLESLSPLEHRSSDEYEALQDQIQAQVFTLFSSYNDAIAALEKKYQDESALSLGLLYANLGDMVMAKKYLRSAIQQGISPSQTQMALALVNVKSGQLTPAANLLDNITDMYPQEVYTHYPVEAFLKESLFDVNLAQKNFHDNIIHNPQTIYQILFYFSPYKIFNANQSISYIRKGNASIAIDNVAYGKHQLNKSAALSNVNNNIAQAIQMALNFELLKANAKLKQLLELYPRHSIVHYNLALTYAQMGDMPMAHKHFLKSYYLDEQNYLSGAYTIMTSKLIHQENEKLLRIFKDNLAHEPDNDEFDFYRALIDFNENNYPATYHWLEKDKKENPLHLAFDTLIAMSMKKSEMAKTYSEKLIHQLPNDILPHLLYIDTHFAHEEQKTFARHALTHLKRQTFSMQDYYHGPFITRYLYTQYAQITGSLHPLREMLQDRMRFDKKEPSDIIQNLALVNIYTQNFEEAYTLYNELIDTYKQQDSKTLFLAAMAATGAKHPANAIALLELARRKNPYHYESRYALGLLYLQTEDNKGAAISFRHIKESDFYSQYFDFKIKKTN